jgi:hypothetical protein
MLVGLLFLIAGGAGLFYTFANLLSSDPLWVIGIIVFATFTLFGLGLLVFLALFNQEFD